MSYKASVFIDLPMIFLAEVEFDHEPDFEDVMEAIEARREAFKLDHEAFEQIVDNSTIDYDIHYAKEN